MRCAGGQRELCRYKVRAPKSAHVALLRERLALPKIGELVRGDQYRRAVEAEAEHRRRPERFAGLGTVGDARVEREKSEPRRFVQFGPLVCVDEIADGVPAGSMFCRPSSISTLRSPSPKLSSSESRTKPYSLLVAHV